MDKVSINKNDIEEIQKAASARWGNWVKYLIGAIIGALAAGGVLTVSGCGLTDFTIAGTDGGSLVLKQDPETGRIVIVGARPVLNQKGK